MEARIVFSKLQANGIECFLTNENASSLLWHLSVAHGGVNLMMARSEFDEANSILEEEPTTIEELDSEGQRCPKCDSNNVRFGSQSRQRINWLQLIVLFLFAVPAPVISKAYHCFNCGNNFEPDKY